MFSLAPLDKARTEVVDQEGQHQTSHEDSSGGGFVFQNTQTLVCEHELGVGEEMDECGGDDDTGSKLLEDDEDDVVGANEVELPGQDGGKHTKSTGKENDEEQADS